MKGLDFSNLFLFCENTEILLLDKNCQRQYIKNRRFKTSVLEKEGIMPPKAKFTKDEIIECAVNITRQQGMEGVTAREISRQLGSSPRPIFTVFASMEEVKQEVVGYARAVYRKYVEDGLASERAFRGVGIAYITFALQEPKFFQLLFMKETDNSGDTTNTSLQAVLEQVEDSYDEILRSIMEPYALAQEEAEKIYRHMWVYTHGIATMCATKVCLFSGEQISIMITEIFKSILMAMKRRDI